MQFSDIAVSERLAFENSSFYLRPQGTALVISSSEIWRRSKGHWHFFFGNFNQKSKMSSKQTLHTCFQSVWPWKDGGYHSYGKLCLLLQNSFWSFAATAKNLEAEEEVPEKRIVNRKRGLDRQVRLQQMPSRPSVIGGRQEQRRK